MLMVITALLSHEKGVNYCCVWSQFSLDVFQTCCSMSCLVLLSLNLPSLLKFMGCNCISVTSLTKQSTHTFLPLHSANFVEFHTIRYPWYVLLQPNSLAGPGRGASCAPYIWFINSCSPDTHHTSGVFGPTFPWVAFFTGRWWFVMSHLASSLLILFEAASW